MSAEQMKNQRAIVNTLRFMHIQVERLQSHATIVGDGAQALALDTLLAQIEQQGIIADEVLIRVNGLLDTQDDMQAVRVYDANGVEVV
jgi:hypothetical protein